MANHPLDDHSRASRLLSELSTLESEFRALAAERADLVGRYEARRADWLGRIAMLADSLRTDDLLRNEFRKAEEMADPAQVPGTQERNDAAKRILMSMFNPEKPAGHAAMAKCLLALERLARLSVAPQNYAQHILAAGGLNAFICRPLAARRRGDKKSVTLPLLCPPVAVGDLRALAPVTDVSATIRVYSWSDGTVMLQLVDIGPEPDFGD